MGQTTSEFLKTLLGRVLSDLVELLSDADQDFRPTIYAFIRTQQLIEGAGNLMGSAFPYGYAYGDGDGGIRIEWKNLKREIRLQIPAHEGEVEYIYNQEDEAHSIDKFVSPQNLAGWLSWLITT